MLCAILSFAHAQPKGKKSYVFKGKVEKVTPSNKTLTVANENIEGWMSAMTMDYLVDKPDDVLKRVKAGDQITATVFDGDYTLYDVKVVPKGEKPPVKNEKPPAKN